MTNSRLIKFRYEILDHNDLLKGSIDIKDCSVRLNSLAQIKRTAKFTIKENILKEINYLNDRIRPIVIINDIEYPVGVFLMPSPRRRKTQDGIIREVEAYDTTQILLEDKITDRYFIKSGTKYTKAITQIINSAYIFRVSIEPSEFVLKRDREFEPGTSKLAIVNTLLEELNYTSIYSDGDGVLNAKEYVLPNFRNVDFNYNDGEILSSPENLKVAYSTIDEIDLFNVPNVFVRVASNAEQKSSMVAKYINDSPTSITSTINRKRNIVDYQTVSDIADQTTLNNYVKRIAYNATNQFKKIEFETLINPKHSYSDCLYIIDRTFKIKEKYIETSWEFNLKAGATMKHQARRVIQI